MLKNISRLECMIGNRIYHLTCDSDSPLNEVQEALAQFSSYVLEIERNFLDKQKSQVAEEISVGE